MLGASGHIAGVVNPPQPSRRNYWTNDLLTDDADDWLAARRRASPEAGGRTGTLARRNMAARAARHRNVAGNATYSPLEPAPGDYVREPA